MTQYSLGQIHSSLEQLVFMEYHDSRYRVDTLANVHVTEDFGECL